MTNSITVNGNTYNDGAVAPNNMDAGGFRTNLIPMLSDAVIDFAAKQAAAASSASGASSSATAAAASAATAANQSNVASTSTTSLTVGLGNQTLTVQTGKSITTGMQLRIASTATPTTWMDGVATAYNSGTGALTVNVTNISGSGTLASWNVFLSGAPGTTGVVNTLKGANIASAATVNLDTATGNVIHITGTTGITAFTLTDGRERTLIFDGILTITNGTNVKCPGGLNITTAVGDMCKIVQDGTASLLYDYVKVNGQANVSFGAGGGTATGNVTLTSTSNGAQVITPATPGLYATLPDATTCMKAATLFIISNIGEYDYGVKNSAGTQLGWIRPGQTCVIGLGDNSTAAGSWACSSLEKVGITAFASTTTPSGITSSISVQRVALDANRTCLIFGGTSIYGIIYDASTQTWGTATLIRSGIASGAAYLSILSATNQVLVISSDATTGFNAVTLTVAANTITVNTAATTVLAGNWAAFGQLIAVGTSWVVSYGRATTTSAIRALTISGTTVTIGSESVLNSSNTTAGTVYANGSANLLTLYDTGTTLVAKPFSISGATLTAGTQANITETASGYRSLALGSGRWIASYLNTTNFASIISVNTGTNTATASSATVGTAPSDTKQYLDMIAVSSTKVCMLYHTASTSYFINNVVDNAGTINVGTEISQSVQGNVAGFGGAAISVSGNTVLFSVKTSSAAYSVVVDASGASPVQSNVIPLFGPPTNCPFASDMYGNRDGRNLFAGGAGYALPNTTANTLTSRFSTSSAAYRPTISLPSATINTAIGAANESWVFSQIGQSTGASLCRVEAAA